MSITARRLSRAIRIAFLLATTLSLLPLVAAPKQKSSDLSVYFVDVEGGQATLFVTPEKHSLLIDTGWLNTDGRDANRILAAAKDAGIDRLDFVLLTHYHVDHAGGFTELAQKIPIGAVFDHGEVRQNDAVTQQVFNNYVDAVAKKNIPRVTAKPSEVLPISGIHVEVISSDGATITHSLPDAGPGAGQENPACAQSGPYSPDLTENARSLGTLITFGKLRILDLGDLTNDKELLFMCPKNSLGKVDILIVSHHGTATSNSPALVWGIAPRVAIFDNGATKGGQVRVLDTVRSSPGLEDFWQLHYSEAGGAEHNTAAQYIANPQGADAAYYLTLTGHKDGSFEIFNQRTKETKKYAAKERRHPAGLSG